MLKVNVKKDEILVTRLPMLVESKGGRVVLITHKDPLDNQLPFKGITLLTGDKMVTVGGNCHFADLSDFHPYEGTLELSNK